MNFTAEVINSIKTIKLNSWIKLISDILIKLRNSELAVIRKGLCINSFEIATSYLMGTYLALSVFGVFFLTGQTMPLATAFACLHVIYCLETPVKWIPQFIGVLMQFFVSMRRIQGFLLCDEINPNLVETHCKSTMSKNIDILITNANFSWGGKKQFLGFENIVVQDANKSETIEEETKDEDLIEKKPLLIHKTEESFEDMNLGSDKTGDEGNTEHENVLPNVSSSNKDAMLKDSIQIKDLNLKIYKGEFV